MHVGALTMLDGVLNTDEHGPASAVLKPFPLRVTAVETGPEFGVRTKVAVFRVTVRAAVAMSPLLPVTETTYIPGVAVLRTVKLLVVSWPVFVIVHVGALTMFDGVLKTDVHGPASPVLNPVPVMLIAVETGAVFGVNVRDGMVVVTTKVADAKSPVLPFTVTT